MSVQTVTETNFRTSPNSPAAEKSIGELFGDLSRETSQLVRAEVQLAKTEITQKAVSAGKDVGMIAGGVALVGASLLVLTVALVCGLNMVTHSTGISALVVGLLYLIGGGLVAWQGVSGLKHVDPVPHETVETLKEDGQWLKNIRK